MTTAYHYLPEEDPRGDRPVCDFRRKGLSAGSLKAGISQNQVDWSLRHRKKSAWLVFQSWSWWWELWQEINNMAIKISVTHLSPKIRGKAERWVRELEESKLLVLGEGNPLKDETYSIMSGRGDGHPSLPCSTKSSKTTWVWDQNTRQASDLNPGRRLRMWQHRLEGCFNLRHTKSWLESNKPVPVYLAQFVLGQC